MWPRIRHSLAFQQPCYCCGSCGFSYHVISRFQLLIKITAIVIFAKLKTTFHYQAIHYFKEEEKKQQLQKVALKGEASDLNL